MNSRTANFSVFAVLLVWAFNALAEVHTLPADEKGQIDLEALNRKLESIIKALPQQKGAALHSPVTFKAQQLHEKLQSYSATVFDHEELEQWKMAVHNSVTLSLLAQWTSDSLADVQLRSWWQVIRKFHPDESPDLCLSLAITFLQHWAAASPEKSAQLMDDAEKQFYPHASKAKQRMWKWCFPVFAQVLRDSVARVEWWNQSAFQARADERMTQYLNDLSVPVADRTKVICRQATMLYSQGDPSAAAAMLDAWTQRYKGQIDSFPLQLYMARFFIAYLGEGDFQTARRMMARADQLVQDSRIGKDDPQYIVMMQTYYKYLPLTELERATLANRRTQGRKSKSLVHE